MYELAADHLVVLYPGVLRLPPLHGWVECLFYRVESKVVKRPRCWAVNIPDIPYKNLKGFEVTRLGTRHRAEPTIRQTDPRGHTVYWVGPAGSEQDAGPGTDFHAINHHKVSITPLRVDLTHYEAFDQLASWVDRFELDEKV